MGHVGLERVTVWPAFCLRGPPLPDSACSTLPPVSVQPSAAERARSLWGRPPASEGSPSATQPPPRGSRHPREATSAGVGRGFRLLFSGEARGSAVTSHTRAWPTPLSSESWGGAESRELWGAPTGLPSPPSAPPRAPLLGLHRGWGRGQRGRRAPCRVCHHICAQSIKETDALRS